MEVKSLSLLVYIRYYKLATRIKQPQFRHIEYRINQIIDSGHADSGETIQSQDSKTNIVLSFTVLEV